MCVFSSLFVAPFQRTKGTACWWNMFLTSLHAYDRTTDLAVLEVAVEAEDPQLRPGSLADQVQRR